VTEGLATWEEVNRSPSWTRNMRRELVDALANDEVIPTRELNRAFRGPRILFGYYQGGLMCQMLIEKHGFAPMVRLLEAFDRGLDLDAALQEVFAATPEQLDREFDAFAREMTKDLRLEPRWDPGYVDRIRAGLSRKPPGDAKKRAAWVDGWCTVAWSMWQRDLRLDSQEALRHIKDVAPQPPRALFLRGSLALEVGDRATAVEQFEAAIAGGGEDFKARIALASFAADAGDVEACEKHLLAAEKAFPGYDDKDLSAELRLADLYDEHERTDEALAARERWLRWNGGEVAMRLEIARWHVARASGPGGPDKMELDKALAQFNEINEIDPFLRAVHRDWGDALRSAGRLEEALREYRMILAVPSELDGLDKAELDEEAQAEVIGLQSACLLGLGRNAEALERAKAALLLDEDCEIARETLEKAQ
jgi:tetratricopeptide (TPR) repeat protein